MDVEVVQPDVVGGLAYRPVVAQSPPLAHLALALEWEETQSSWSVTSRHADFYVGAAVEVEHALGTVGADDLVGLEQDLPRIRVGALVLGPLGIAAR